MRFEDVGMTVVFCSWVGVMGYIVVQGNKRQKKHEQFLTDEHCKQTKLDESLFGSSCWLCDGGLEYCR